jgi:hypothetical protein
MPGQHSESVGERRGKGLPGGRDRALPDGGEKSAGSAAAWTSATSDSPSARSGPRCRAEPRLAHRPLDIEVVGEPRVRVRDRERKAVGREGVHRLPKDRAAPRPAQGR